MKGGIRIHTANGKGITDKEDAESRRIPASGRAGLASRRAGLASRRAGCHPGGSQRLMENKIKGKGIQETYSMLYANFAAIEITNKE